jgi:DNA-binding MarR family transcriptional regulator
MTAAGADLALLLLGAYRRLVDQAVDELDRLGHAGMTPNLHYAMAAVDAGAASASELAHATAVTKQAAAKTITALASRGYVSIESDATDSRRKRVTVTPLGHRVMTEGAQIFDRLREDWAERIGVERLAAVEDTLRELVGEDAIRLDSPGWSSGV